MLVAYRTHGHPSEKTMRTLDKARAALESAGLDNRGREVSDG